MPWPGEGRDRTEPECDGDFLGLAGEDFGVRQARVVIDRVVQVRISGPCLAGPSTSSQPPASTGTFQLPGAGSSRPRGSGGRVSSSL